MYSFPLPSVSGDLKYLVTTNTVASITHIKYDLPFALEC